MAFAGYNATVNGACNSGTKWTVELTTDLLDATTFCSDGYKEYIEGLKGGTFTIEALDEVTIPTDSSVSFVNDGITISGKVLTSSVTYDTSVEGLCTFVYKGSFNATISVS